MYKKETKASRNVRIYEEDIAVINSLLSASCQRVADYIHYLLIEHGDIDEKGQRILPEDHPVLSKDPEIRKRTSVPKDELEALLKKHPSVSQEEADKVRPFSPYYYPRTKRKEDKEHGRKDPKKPGGGTPFR